MPAIDTAPAPATGNTINFAAELRKQTSACRVRHFKMRTRRSLTRSQVAQAAQPFDAEADVLTAAKKLFDTRDPAYRAVVRVRQRATKFWQSMTVPYPEAGIRLIKRERIADFDKQMRDFRDQLEDAVTGLQDRYEALIVEARHRLGTLFNQADYPDRVDTEFEMEWDFPSVDPPGYLKNLNPALYEQQSRLIAARFEEAVKRTEEVFMERFRDLVAHLAERLKGDVDGKPKRFKDSSVENLTAFFEEFKALNVGSSVDLDRLMAQAQSLVAGVTPDALREADDTRRHVADGLTAIQGNLDALMEARPRRAIRLEEENNAGASGPAAQEAA